MVEPFIIIYIPNKSIFGGELRWENRLILHVLQCTRWNKQLQR